MATDTDKKKLGGFMSELLRCSTVKGFLHFSLHPRGREELLCSVKNQPVPLSNPSSAAGSLNSSYEGQALSTLPRNEQSLMLSSHTQRRLSGFGFINVGLPPASPSSREAFPVEGGSTLFMIACYQRYNCPYAWVRSNHARLVRRSGSGGTGKEDNPLKLQSTSHWLDTVIHPWDILSELIQLCMEPVPANPFAVDFDYFDQLAMDECILATGAMACFLRKVLLTRHHSFDQRVSDDLKRILQLHFSTLCQYAAGPSGVDGAVLDQSASSAASPQLSTSAASVGAGQQQGFASHPGSFPPPTAASRTLGQATTYQPPTSVNPATSVPYGQAPSNVTASYSAPAPSSSAPQHAGEAMQYPSSSYSTAGPPPNLPPLQFTPPTVGIATPTPEKPPSYFGTPPTDRALGQQFYHRPPAPR